MRVLFVTADPVGQRRAGLAIRLIGLARVVAKRHRVTVASAQPGAAEFDGMEFMGNALADPGPLRRAVLDSDVVVTQGMGLFLFPFLKRARHLVIDLCDPYLFEYLVYNRTPSLRWGYLRQWHLLNDQLCRGDFFICASERQRDYWLGRLCALGRLTPEQYRCDPTFRRLLEVVPFGIPVGPPRGSKPVVKGIIPGIVSSDFLLLWAGGIWQWFDPLTLIRALDEVRWERSDIKLLFLGAEHPSSATPEMPIVREARGLARDLGLLDRWVFFGEGWAPQSAMQDYLREADIGVATYLDIVETRFAVRTRVLDYIGAGLPMILTRGDVFADLVEQQKLGETVRAGDVEGLKNAILRLAADAEQRQDIRRRLSEMAPQFHWETVAEPLLRYCDSPYASPKPSRWRQEAVPFLNWIYRRFYRISRFHAS